MRYSTLIVDDERIARNRMVKLLEKHSNQIDIIGEAENGIVGLEKINTLRPQLVFLDIEMPGLTGFEMLQKVNTQPKIIFTTAYDEFALKAFEENSIDYLVKPIHPERLEKAINKLPQLDSFAALQQLAQQLSQPAQQKLLSTISVAVGNKIVLVKIENIILFKAEDKYITVFDVEGNKHIITQSLNYLEEQLPPNFIRVHRTYIINKDKITEIRKTFNSRYLFILKGAESENIQTGTSYTTAVKKVFSL
jgi:two-component system, LytTR family, response regulator